MLVIVFILMTENVPASTIILKDGRTITGNIIQQDKTKVVVKEGEDSLTYYKDEIASIDKESLGVKDNGTTPEAEKEKLVEQVMIYDPMDEIISNWVKNTFKPNDREIILSYENANILALTNVRKQIVTQYFSLADLKAALNFYSTAEGKQFLKDYREYHNHMVTDLNPILRKIAEAAKRAANK